MNNALFLSPHADDVTLFGSFITQQEGPEVWIITDGKVQLKRGQTEATSDTMRQEALSSLEELGIWDDRRVHFGGFSDIDPNWLLIHDLLVGIRASFPANGWSRIYTPYPEPHPTHHAHHNLIGIMTAEIFGPLTRFYTTYTRYTGKTGLTTPNAREYCATDGGQVQRKLRALACYRSQMDVGNCREHFLRDLKEYVVDYRPGEMWWEEEKGK